MSYFRNFDTIGLISLNDWYVIDFPIIGISIFIAI